MSEYIITLIGTLIVCSLALMIAPEEEKGLAGYVRLVAGLCVLCVAISPISEFLGSVFDFEFSEDSFLGENNAQKDYSEIFEENLKDASAASIAEGLRSMLCREFDLKNEQIEVSVSICEDGSDYATESVTVALVGVNSLFVDPHDIIDYVAELLGCRCEIVYG